MTDNGPSVKCPGAETLLRAVIDNDEGVGGAVKRARWLAGQDPAYLIELADACTVLARMAARGLEDRRVEAVRRAFVEAIAVPGAPR
jgi:L-asparaginase II